MADGEIVQVERSGKRQKVKKKGVCREGGMAAMTSMGNGGGGSKGSKDRHSKVRTSRGLRDRRVRLSPTCALRLFDIQDRLGFDQPSKAVDWLLDKAQRAIHQLPALHQQGLPDLEQPPPQPTPQADPAPLPAPPRQASHAYDTLSLSLSSSSHPPAAADAPLSLSGLNTTNITSAPRRDIKEESQSSLPISRCDHHHHLRPSSPGHLRALLL